MEKSGDVSVGVRPRGSRLKIYISVLLCAAFLALGVTTAAALSAKNIYRGVEINNIKIGGKSRDEAVELLQKEYEGRDKITASFSGRQHELTLRELGISYSPEKTVERAYQIAREGNVFNRLGGIVKTAMFKAKLPMEIDVSEERLNSVINKLCEGTGVPPKNHSFEIMEGKLAIHTGSPGRMVNPEKVRERILSAVKENDFTPLSFEIEEILPPELNIDRIYESVCSEVEDARYEVEDRKVKIIEEKVGVSFDKAKAREILSQGEKHGAVFYIPLEFTYPKVTKADIEKILFSYTLGEYSTNYNTGDVGRSNNLALAARKINGVVLAPGEVFSYNDVVGNRTYAEGFSTAKVILNGQYVDGVGGGVCQVSTTLYNAVLLANLGVVSRQNHNLAVAYVPKGQDATVVYGSIDFKFKNTTEYPIKILASASSGTMRASILGTKPEIEEKVTITNKVVSVLPNKTQEQQDPSLPFGKRVVVQNGTPGYVVDTYKTVERNGVKGEPQKISTSRYLAVDTIVRVGTGPAEPTVEPDQGVPEQPIDQPSVTPSAPPGAGPSQQADEPTAAPEGTTAPTGAPTAEPVPDEIF